MNTTSTNPQPQLPIGTMIGNLKIVKALSIGQYGQVYRAIDIVTFKKYAVKSLPHTGLSPRQIAFQENEIKLHSQLSDHNNIIRLEKVVKAKDWTHAILEYGSDGDLFSAIIDKNIYYGNHDLIRDVFLQLIEAVDYSHSQNIYHRDLKPENVLVFDNGRTLKLADFGLATTNTFSTDYGCGSTFYFSPECQGGLNGKINRVGYATAPNDVWALGIILINLSTGRNPWKLASLEDETFRAYLRDPKLLPTILPVSMELNKILKRIFCLDPAKRITLDKLYDKIRSCRFFTRTAEVERYERILSHAVMQHSRYSNSNSNKTRNKNATRIMQTNNNTINNDDLPSPPGTPSDCGSTDIDSSTCSSQSSLIEPADNMHTDSIDDYSCAGQKGDNLDNQRNVYISALLV